MYKAILVALMVLVSYGISDAATVQVSQAQHEVDVNLQFGDTISVNPNDIKGDIFIECSYNNKPEERATMFIQTALVPKHKFSIYCTERDDTIVIGLGSSK